jgi:hypothetical protein
MSTLKYVPLLADVKLGMAALCTITLKWTCDDIEQISILIKQDILHYDENLTSISIISSTDFSTQHLNELDQSFMYS